MVYSSSLDWLGLKLCTILCSIVLALTSGCTGPAENVPITVIPAFKDDRFELLFEATDTDTLVVVTRVRPLFKGSGRIRLYGWGSHNLDTVFVLAPLTDTLNTYDSASTRRISTHHVRFEPNAIVETRWKVKLQSYQQVSFNFAGSATMDSVYIPDSSSYVASDTRAAKYYMGVGPMEGAELQTRTDYIHYP